jgi:hypothetical protein
MATDRVTVTLPSEVVQEIDRREENRSRFVLDAVKRELVRRRREELRRSLRAPHPESLRLAAAGIHEWAKALPDEGAEALVDLKKGTAVRWVPGRGWEEGRA